MVTVNEVIKELQKIVAKNPEFGELPCIYSHDDEGNEFQGVINTPTLVYVLDEDGKEFNLESPYRFLELTNKKKKYNAVIIN